jgi:hypothetical protein
MKHSHEAMRSANLFDCGCGHLVVSRFRADGSVEAGFFLLDVYCLGVKDAGYHHFFSMADYQESLLDRLFPDGNPVRMTPAAARKLTENAISYARGFGFSPGADYRKASRVLGGITTADCAEQFVFGKDGKPLYIQGPSDSPARVGRILRALEARCGEGGYHYIVSADDFELFDDEEPNGEYAVSGPAGRTGLEDAIRLVAEPLLESAPDYKSKEMILKLATLAWNFTLLDPIEQRKMLVKIADLFQGTERKKMFYYLARRKAFLFPDEERAIWKVEMEPALYGDVTVRVASPMGV